jgi:hypothetical protein
MLAVSDENTKSLFKEENIFPRVNYQVENCSKKRRADGIINKKNQMIM